MRHASTLTAASGSDADPGAHSAVWRVRLLGGFHIDDGSQRVTRLPSRAAVALLARVALAPGRDHAREELAALLWPDADEATGRNRLRQTLSTLKAMLEPPGAPLVLQADRRVVRAAAGALWCDAQAFEQAFRGGRAEQARALYGGELLPGFYDEWLLDERSRLQALFDRLGDGGVPTATGAGTTAAEPAPAAASARLPQYLTRLIGADQQGARLQALVSEHRLVTVLGPGGCGKTRLAVEVARLAGPDGRGGQRDARRFDGCVFVSLVDAGSRTELLDRLQAALRVDGAGDVIERLLATLQRRALLVVLDNAEQLHDDATAAIAHLAERAPQVHWLVTSRRPLGLDGERSFPLGALELPAADAPAAELAMNPALALFVDRARAHRPEFHLTPVNRAALVALVHWLDGLPLAIELAASHVRTLGPAELLALLQAARKEPGAAGLNFLARRGARSGSDPRHASMHAVIAWSWQLLTPPQQQLLAALALLPAGARLAMAAALAGTPEQLAQTQSLLADLVASSVLRVQPGADGSPRYAPYEPVREYALAQHDAASMRAAHRRALDALLAWAQAMPATPPLAAVRDELPNLAQALHVADSASAGDAVRLVLLLQSSWGEIAVPGGVLDALDRLLQTPGLDDSLAAGGHALAAWSNQEAGRPDDVRRHVAAAGARPCPDPSLRAMVLSRLARMHWRLDRNHILARELIAQALPLAREVGRPNTEAALLSLEAHLCTVIDRNPARGTELAAQSLALWQRSGNRHLVNAGRYNVAVNRMQAGAPAAVLDELSALADEGRELQDWDLASGAMEARGTALQMLRRWPESLDALRDSVQLAWDGLQMMALAYALWNLPPSLLRLRQAELAAQVMAAAQLLWRERFGAFDAGDLRQLKRVRRGCRVLLGPAAAQAAWRRGEQRPLADVIADVLAARG